MSGFEDGRDGGPVAAEALRDAASAPYGLTALGFTPKPYGRLVAEGMALARELFGPSVDLERGSVIRKLLELSSLEDARTWAALARAYDDSFVATASGGALPPPGTSSACRARSWRRKARSSSNSATCPTAWMGSSSRQARGC